MRSKRLLAIALVAAALLAASCSSSDDTARVASLETATTVASPDTETQDPDTLADTEAAMLAFAQCLRDQGINIDDPTIDANGNVQLPPITLEFEAVEGEDPEEAMADLDGVMESCNEHLEGITATADAPDMTGIEDDFLAYAACMRDNGVEMPDPDFSSDGGIVELGAGDEAEFEAADAECRHLISNFIIDG